MDAADRIAELGDMILWAEEVDGSLAAERLLQIAMELRRIIEVAK